MMSSLAASKDRIDGRLVYAVGDIHGRYDLLIIILGQIAADIADRAAGRHPILIFCGDYIDRGPDSAKVIEALIWLRQDQRFEIRLLKGNHEDALLAFIDEPETKGHWLKVGGRATLTSYGVDPAVDPDDPQACRGAREALASRMPHSHLLLLSSLETIAIIGDYAFVHAGIRPNVAMADQAPRDLMWIREPFLTQTDRFEKRVVHGHSWTSAAPQVLENRINIDTGAFKTGNLTAICIEDDRLTIFQTSGEARVVSYDAIAAADHPGNASASAG